MAVWALALKEVPKEALKEALKGVPKGVLKGVRLLALTPRVNVRGV